MNGRCVAQGCHFSREGDASGITAGDLAANRGTVGMDRNELRPVGDPSNHTRAGQLVGVEQS